MITDNTQHIKLRDSGSFDIISNGARIFAIESGSGYSSLYIGTKLQDNYIQSTGSVVNIVVAGNISTTFGSSSMSTTTVSSSNIISSERETMTIGSISTDDGGYNVVLLSNNTDIATVTPDGLQLRNIICQNSGSQLISGESTISSFGRIISSDMCFSTSIVQLTPKTDTPVGFYYVSAVNNGNFTVESTDAGSDDGKGFMWVITN